jgi:hypothetical protein
MWRIVNNQEISPLQDTRNYDMDLFAEFGCCPLSSAEGGAFFWASGWA